MLEVGDEDEVGVDDHVGHEVVGGHRGEAEGVDGVAEQRDHSDEGDVRLQDEVVLLGLEEDGRGREVVHVHAPVLRRTGHSESDVRRPANREHEENTPQIGDGRLSK